MPKTCFLSVYKYGSDIERQGLAWGYNKYIMAVKEPVKIMCLNTATVQITVIHSPTVAGTACAIGWARFRIINKH